MEKGRIARMTIDLTLDTAAGSINGEIRESGGGVRRFGSRLELLSELERFGPDPMLVAGEPIGEPSAGARAAGVPPPSR